tara:strand:- start:248 stop:1399 length:1152 start_codon:yes stop_codon:yes gene_type:complete
MTKFVSILGSTGSVGLAVLKILDKDRLIKINLLCANKSYSLICSQIKKYKPKIFIINNHLIFKKVKKKFKKKNTIILNTFNSLKIKKKSDITVSAIPGIAGLQPTLKMIEGSKKILIANKESIICGWDLLSKKAKKNKAKIIPIDSEHFSIMKLLETNKLEDINKIYITASGGPFLNYSINQLKKIRPSDALKHPKWKMGKKVTIDSATLMNKILELIEAQLLFNLDLKKLDILIHPESLVHAVVELNNGLCKFIYHDTSMIIPIANAIYEDKLNINHFYIKKNNVIKNLTFKKVNKNIFPIIKLKKKLNEYPATPIIINAANEILVDQFLRKKIPFSSIYKFIMAILKDRNYRKYAIKRPKNINQIFKVDNWARNRILEKLK